MAWELGALTKEQQILVLVNVALVCAQVGFGGFNVVGKYALDYIHPIIFAFYREVISGPLLFIIATIVERVKPAPQDWWRLALLGFILYGNQFCFIVGLKLTNSASQTAIIQQCIPVFTSAITVALKMERFSLIKLAGLVFAVSGAVVMIGFNDLSLDNNHTLGMLILLGNTLLLSIYYILQKPLLEKYPPITVTGWAYIAASIAMGFTSLYYINDLSAFVISTKVIWPLAYAVGVQTIFGYCCVSWANKHAPASLVAIYNCIQPIVAFILARIFFHEMFIWNDGVGMALVIAGLVLVTWVRARESNEDAEKKNNAQNENNVQKDNNTENERTKLLSLNVDPEGKHA